MKIDDADLTHRMRLLIDSEATVFSLLCEISGLDPREDFQHANLQEVDFRGSDLTGYNFRFADLRHAIWDENAGEKSIDCSFALRGRDFSPVRGSDWSEFKRGVFESKRWAERFLSFAFLVDNFGENELTARGLLAPVLRGDRSKYAVETCKTYFLASYLDNKEAMKYCRAMADAGHSPGNAYRLRKLRRYRSDLLRYISTVHTSEEWQLRGNRYPGDINPLELVAIFEEEKSEPERLHGPDPFRDRFR